jgi:hypothetical protein
MDGARLWFRNPMVTHGVPWSDVSSFDIAEMMPNSRYRGVWAVLSDGTRVPIGCLAWMFPARAEEYAARLQVLVDAHREPEEPSRSSSTLRHSFREATACDGWRSSQS